MDSSPDPSATSSASTLDMILSGCKIDKDRLIRDVTVEFLDGINFIRMTRSELVNDLFAHVHAWVAMVNELQGRRWRYHNLTPEQVVLILIKRHSAMTAPADAVPDSWDYTEVQTRTAPTGKRVLGVHIDPSLRLQPHGVLVKHKSHHTSLVTINALASHYRPSITTQQLGRVRNLLHQWAPQVPTTDSSTTPKGV